MQGFQITPTTPANACVGLFRNYLNHKARSKRECDKGKPLEISSIKTYASCLNCFVNRVARSRPLNKVLHPNFLKRVEKNDRNGALKKVIQMDRNGLKLFKEFYESECRGKFPDDQLYVDDPNLEIVQADTIVFDQNVTRSLLLDGFRNHFAASKGDTDLFEILKEYDAYREQLEKQHFYESNGIDIEVVMANT